MIPPFYAQWESAARIHEILAGTLRAADDPLWPRSGAASAADYERWADHLCGVACLRMVLAARGITPPRAIDLARDLTHRGGYVLQPDGFIRGLIYAPAVTWLREAHGIAADVRVDLPVEEIPEGLFIASVHPSIRRAGVKPPSRGGHLVVVFGTRDGVVRFHNPSGDSVATQVDARLPVGEFACFYAGRGIALR